MQTENAAGPTRNAAGVAVAVHGDDRGTPERRGHDAVEIVDTFEDGRRARAARAEDTLGRLLRNGTIAGEMARDGRRFQASFHTAGLNALRAMKMERIAAGAGGEGERVMAAREEVAAVMRVMGGHGSPAGAALWFVLGTGCTIREWAGRERMGAGAAMNEHTAKGILIGALSALGAYYEKPS